MKAAVAGRVRGSRHGATQKSRRKDESEVIESGFEAKRIATPAKEARPGKTRSWGRKLMPMVTRAAMPTARSMLIGTAMLSMLTAMRTVM